ncbi:unnamed protein product, partial [Closterium sp. NIES-53]
TRSTSYSGSSCRRTGGGGGGGGGGGWGGGGGGGSGGGGAGRGGAVQGDPSTSPALMRPRRPSSFLPLASPLPAPSPYVGPTRGLAERHEPGSRPVSPARTSRRAPRHHPPVVPGTHQMALRPSTAPLRVPLPSPQESTLPALADPESDSLRAASPTVTHFLATAATDPSFESAAASALVA